MNGFKTIMIVAAAVMIFAGVNAAQANKAAVTIEAPQTAAPGSEITIKISVTHSDNNALHHVDWTYIKVGGKQLGRWDYASNKLPEGKNFSKEIKVKVDGPLEIEAEAHCNLHGSAGVSKAAVLAR